jgi:hypothetical protein
MRHPKFILLLLLLTVFVGIAPAQDSFDKYCAKVQILQDRKVQNELGITSAQRDKMNKMAAKHEERLQAYHKKVGDKPDMKVLQGYLNQLTSEVQTILTKKQVIRLRELNLQAAGLSGVADPVVAKKIGMDAAHLKKFQTTLRDGQMQIANLIRPVVKPIEVKYQKKMQAYQGKEKDHQKELVTLNNAFQGEMRAAQNKLKSKIEAISKQTEAKLLAIMTPAQKKTWTTLKGKPFVVK